VGVGAVLREGWMRVVWRTETAHLVLPQTFPLHHADPGHSGDIPGEKSSMLNKRFSSRTTSQSSRTEELSPSLRVITPGEKGVQSISYHAM